MNKLQITVVERGDLADVLRGIGNPRDAAISIRDGRVPGKLHPACVGIGYIDNHSGPFPDFLVIPGSDRREFFAWVNTYCPFVTPLSQWCRVVSEEELVRIQPLEIVPKYGRFASAWAGAVVGEALLNVGINGKFSQLSVAALQSCASFVAARTFGLWGSGRIFSVSMKQYTVARNILGTTNRNSDRLECQNFWTVLEILSGSRVTRLSNHLELVVQSCEDISKTGFVSIPIISQMTRKLGWSEELVEFEESGAEQRIVLFDSAVEHLSRSASRMRQDSRMLGEFTVAYFAARIGGSASARMPLLEKLADKHPMIILWYGVVSALYRSEIWGMEFDGLGRLALKELSFPLHFDDPPRCDIAFDELIALVEPSAGSRSLRFRGATHKALNVEVSLGVNTMISLSPPSEPVSSVTLNEEVRSEMAELHRHLKAATESANRLGNVHGLSASDRSNKSLNQNKKRAQSKRNRLQSGSKNRKGRLDDDRESSRSDANSVSTPQMELVE